MSEKEDSKNTAEGGVLSSGEINAVTKQYEEIKPYEHHFNNLETEIRKIASGWLLAAVGAIAYLIKETYLGNIPLIDSKIIAAQKLISLVSVMGMFGLLVLWVLDQVVYHSLLNAVFLLGLRMEYRYDFLPPVRTLMMLLSNKRGMARYTRIYYFGPMAVLSFLALYFFPNKSDAVFWVGSLVLLFIHSFIIGREKVWENI